MLLSDLLGKSSVQNKNIASFSTRPLALTAGFGFDGKQ